MNSEKKKKMNKLLLISVLWIFSYAVQAQSSKKSAVVIDNAGSTSKNFNIGIGGMNSIVQDTKYSTLKRSALGGVF